MKKKLASLPALSMTLIALPVFSDQLWEQRLDAGFAESGSAVEVDADGNEIWRAVFDGPASGFDVGISATLGPAGTTIIAGYAGGVSGHSDLLLLAYDERGAQVWSATYDGPAARADLAADVTTATGGRVVVTGSSDGFDELGDVVTLMYDSGLGDFHDDFETADTSAWSSTVP